jgi:hypothetical protein
MIAIPYTFVIALRQETATWPLMRRQPPGTPTITHAAMKKVVWRAPHIAVKSHLKRHSTQSFADSDLGIWDSLEQLPPRRARARD